MSRTSDREGASADPGAQLVVFRRLGPGSAAHHFASLVLRCARDTRPYALALAFTVGLPRRSGWPFSNATICSKHSRK